VRKLVGGSEKGVFCFFFLYWGRFVVSAGGMMVVFMDLLWSFTQGGKGLIEDSVFMIVHVVFSLHML
jgi:hypothetical protein